MEGAPDRIAEDVEKANPVFSAAATAAKPALPAAPADKDTQHEPRAAAANNPPGGKPTKRHLRRWLLTAVIVAGLATGVFFLYPWVVTALNTVSTDDAYINGHLTFVAPRVSGQVLKVLVDDNYRVKKGDLLVQLDPEPYQVQVAIKKAAVESAKMDVEAAIAQARGLVGESRSNRFKMDHAIEEVDNAIANLHASVATLNSRKANLVLAEQNLKRGEELFPTRAISKENLDELVDAYKVAQAVVEQALQDVYAKRVGLSLPAEPATGETLDTVPPNLNQNFSTVRQALADTLRSAAQLGYFPTSWNATPDQAKDAFYKQDAQRNLDKIYARLVENAPAVKQAEARLLQAERDLDNAELNLRYCNIASEIDGVVASRNVNPGNYVQIGQSLMTVRSLTEIWIDANFKETQLANLRIGQRVRCDVDMYGRRRTFAGRITGFTMGTGQSLELLPPQNATGNFVKIVQRLPVRIELTGYNPDKDPLFIGLSVVPYVYYKESPSGPNAGDVLQPLARLPQGPARVVK
jgi:membrane fusion protein, multidrug efflux system